MRHFGAQVLKFFAVLSIALVCSRCAEPGPLGSGAGAGLPTSVQGRAPGALDMPGTKAARADQILDLRVDDSPEAILVRITGNGSLQDYEFRRSGDRGFVLAFNDVLPGGTSSLLPVSSDLLTLNSGETASPKGLQLVGALRQPLDYYAIDTVENQLILTLYLVKGTPGLKSRPASTRSVGCGGCEQERIKETAPSGSDRFFAEPI